MSGTLAAYEKALVALLRADDPAAAWQALPAGERALFDGFDPDGLALSALLVARLRFERVHHGSARASAWFEQDPAAFARAFRRYQAEVPADCWLAQDEGRRFDAWCRG